MLDCNFWAPCSAPLRPYNIEDNQSAAGVGALQRPWSARSELPPWPLPPPSPLPAGTAMSILDKERLTVERDDDGSVTWTLTRPLLGLSDLLPCGVLAGMAAYVSAGRPGWSILRPQRSLKRDLQTRCQMGHALISPCPTPAPP